HAVANFLFDGQNRIFHMGTIPLAAPQMGTGYIFYQPLPQEDELRYLIIRICFMYFAIALA
ncbi:hypothetical protein, partial [Klebsiella quasipneumoniae]